MLRLSIRAQDLTQMGLLAVPKDPLVEGLAVVGLVASLLEVLEPTSISKTFSAPSQGEVEGEEAPGSPPFKRTT